MDNVKNCLNSSSEKLNAAITGVDERVGQLDVYGAIRDMEQDASQIWEGYDSILAKFKCEPAYTRICNFINRISEALCVEYRKRTVDGGNKFSKVHKTNVLYATAKGGERYKAELKELENGNPLITGKYLEEEFQFLQNLCLALSLYFSQKRVEEKQRSQPQNNQEVKIDNT